MAIRYLSPFRIENAWPNISYPRRSVFCFSKRKSSQTIANFIRLLSSAYPIANHQRQNLIVENDSLVHWFFRVIYWSSILSILPVTVPTMEKQNACLISLYFIIRNGRQYSRIIGFWRIFITPVRKTQWVRSLCLYTGNW